MKLNRIFAVFAAVLLAGLPVFAQTTANLTGTVTLDGNPIPGVTVTISSPQLQGVRTDVTSATGNYNFGALPPGDYTVTFEMESMQRQTKQVRVGVAQTARVDATMRLASVAEAITVTASAPAVLETTEVQSNIEARLVEELPVNRTLIGTVSLAPGTTQTGPNNATTISGAPSFENLFLVDGATVNENLRGQPHDLFIEDAIQETTVLTGGISAEYGRFTGGVVTAITKSGGNEFSGSLRDTLNKADWTSTSPLGEDQPKGDLLHTYEGTLGGRIIRDRLWFFTAGRYFKRDTPAFFAESTLPYTQARKQSRMELKLTGQITPKHSLTLSGLNIKDDQLNNAFPDSVSVYDPSALDVSRSTPNSFITAHYSGVITNNFLIEANAARKRFAFAGSGGDKVGDLVNGTNIQNIDGFYAGAPTFCGSCKNEARNNENWTLKGTYYANSKTFGTHNIVAGYDNWKASRVSDNHQSASDFTFYSYSSYRRNAQGQTILDLNNGEGGTAADQIIYWPILQSTRGTDFRTKSIFANDKWDFNNHLSFNIGARYDANVGEDGSGTRTVDDNRLSPRLGVNYDVLGNGRIRLTGSYSEYVAAIAESIGDTASPAGTPSLLYWGYYGPATKGLTQFEALKVVFDWFQSVGGIHNQDFQQGGRTNGISRIIQGGSLGSPYTREVTVGGGFQIGTKGYFRTDLIHRNWKNFYTTTRSLANGKVLDPLAGRQLDLSVVTNSDDFVRKYDAAQFQASYALPYRINIGGNYTYSKLKGNINEETAGSGPVSTTGPQDFAEYSNYARNNPEGYLANDQRHKFRGWISYDQPTPIGAFNFSVLQRFDSGTPYSAIGVIDPRCRPSATNNTRCTRIANPGYASPPTGTNFFFSDRGEFNWDNITATDLAINYDAPQIGRAQLYVQAELRNAFNRQAVVNGNTTVFTASNNAAGCTPSADLTTNRCLQYFDPFTMTAPVRGVHYQLSSQFGKPANPTTFIGTTQGDFQLPRTFLMSFGVKF
jgi:outer membrane receptor protein involved in Fe transport